MTTSELASSPNDCDHFGVILNLRVLRAIRAAGRLPRSSARPVALVSVACSVHRAIRERSASISFLLGGLKQLVAFLAMITR